MAYFKINNVDYSNIVNSLAVTKTPSYVAQSNAAGDTVVDYINTKRTITVGIIPINGEDMARLSESIDAFNVSISFRDPKTNVLTSANCIIPSSNIDYYTIQDGKVLYKPFVLTFNEL